MTWPFVFVGELLLTKLLPSTSVDVPKTSIMAFIAPSLGNVTYFNTGKLFFSANL
jgi:hypothetical protein